MGRLLPLEGLRPLLCLSVIVYHLSRTSYRPPGTKNPPLSFGAAAVSIFFIMSGFVNHMGRKGRAPASIAEGRAFFLKVMARIAPAYMVAQCWAAWHNREWIFRASAWDVASVIFLDVTMLGSWFGTSYAWKFNGSLWFVQSLLWGGTFAYCCLGRAVTVHLQKRPCACLLAVIIACAIRSSFTVLTVRDITLDPCLIGIKIDPCIEDASEPYKYWPLFRIPEFFAGVLTAQLVLSVPAQSSVWTWRLWQIADTLLAATGITMVYYSQHWGDHGPFGLGLLPWRELDKTGDYLLTPVICAFMFAAAATQRQGVVMRALSTPVLVALGPAAMPAYLLGNKIMINIFSPERFT